MYFGKILGFILGIRYAGFFGGLAGLFLGHLADKKIYEMGSVHSSIFKSKLSRQSLFMQTTFAVLGHVSKAKGRVTEDDIDLATALMDQLNLDSQGRKLAQQAFNIGKSAEFPLRQAILEFRQACSGRSDLMRMFLNVQVQAVFLDSFVDPKEMEVLYVIAEALGYSRMQFDQFIAMEIAIRQMRNQFKNGGFYQQNQGNNQYHDYHQYSARPDGSSLDTAYKVLGVSPTDDQSTVKRAYRRLMSENHPDKLVSKGLPKEMLEMAKEKTQQIQSAYDLICQAKGWR